VLSIQSFEELFLQWIKLWNGTSDNELKAETNHGKLYILEDISRAVIIFGILFCLGNVISNLRSSPKQTKKSIVEPTYTQYRGYDGFRSCSTNASSDGTSDIEMRNNRDSFGFFWSFSTKAADALPVPKSKSSEHALQEILQKYNACKEDGTAELKDLYKIGDFFRERRRKLTVIEKTE